MTKIFIQRALNILLLLIFALYLSGGFTFRHKVFFEDLGSLMTPLIVFLCLIFWLRLDNDQFILFRGFSQLEQSIRTKKGPRGLSSYLIILAVVSSLGTFIMLPLVRHWSFASWFWDLGVMEQVIWRKAFGYGLTSTAILNNPLLPLDFLKNQHLNFWLIPTAQLYSLIPRTELLLFLQSLAFILALIPLYKIGRILIPQQQPFLLPLFYWCWEAIHRNNIWDIHESAYIPVLSFWAYYYFLKRKWLQTAFFTLAIALFKEDAWVLAGAMGFYFFSIEKRWFAAFSCLFLGAGVFVSYGVFFNKVNTLSDRYAFLGSNFGETLPILKHDPLIFFRQLFHVGPLSFLLRLIMAGGGFWLFGGWAIIPMIPTFLECALSSNPGMYSFSNHYVISLAGPLFISTAYGIKNLKESKRIKKYFKLILLTGTFLIMSQLHFFEAARLQDYFRSTAWKQRRCLEELVNEIPPGEAVYADDPLATHLSQRELFMTYRVHEPVTLTDAWIATVETTELPSDFRVVDRKCGCMIAHRPF